MRSIQILAKWLTILACGCGGSSQLPPATVADSSADGASGQPSERGGDTSAEPAEAADDGLPKRCATEPDGLCLPSKSFVKRLCGNDYPTVALALFAAGTPWTRGYLTHTGKAWNAGGGGWASRPLVVDEEVIVLRLRAAPKSGGVEVSGVKAGFDALRWDGMCVVLDQGELRFDAPERARNVAVRWRSLEMDTRAALKEVEPVRKEYIRYKKACRGVTVGRVSKACEVADTKLSVLIAEHVRKGIELPIPHKLPR